MSTPKTNPFGQLYQSIRSPRQSQSEKIKISEKGEQTHPPPSSETTVPPLSPRMQKTEKIPINGKSEKSEKLGKSQKSGKLEKQEEEENPPSNLQQEPLTSTELTRPCFRSNPQSWRSSQIIVDPVDTLFEEATYMSELPMDQVILALQKTQPCPHWYFRENKIWHPYNEKLSQELETSYLEKKEKFNLGDIEFDLKKSSSTKKGASKKKKLLRATWFYNSDNANKTELTWSPYEEVVAKKLEQAIEDGFASKRVEVSSTPKRYVVLHVGGTFKQYRDTENAKEEGRMVWRGWEGRCKQK